ncbi:MAG: hypothetical protein U0S76_12935 [Pseudoxanthomonas sp.]|nr:hypothetical protein [Pseudoxanthomonas sp.]
MRALPCLFTVAGVLLVGTAWATQPSEGPRTLEQCAALLPAGQVYSFEITGRVDATGEAPVLSGQMSVSDGTELDRSEETAAFQQCLAALIR